MFLWQTFHNRSGCEKSFILASICTLLIDDDYTLNNFIECNGIACLKLDDISDAFLLINLLLLNIKLTIVKNWVNDHNFIHIGIIVT